MQPDDDEAVLNEVAVMQSLSGDKYVVQVLDFYEEEDYFYIVMEYYAGGDVFDRIVELVHYTEYDARSLAIVLLKAVRSIHKAGLAHRDIKPQVCVDLLVRHSASTTPTRLPTHPSRAEFVLSKCFRQHQHSSRRLRLCKKSPYSRVLNKSSWDSNLCGSRVSSSLFSAANLSSILCRILKNLPHDERVDLWSVGIVIFVLLVGYPPFLDEDQSSLFRKIRTGEWSFIEEDWKHVSEDAKELIRGLLVVDPQERWTIEQCLGCKWIDLDPSSLSVNNLSESLRSLRIRKKILRSSAIGFTGLLDSLKSVAVATQAQEKVVRMEIDN